VCGGGVLERAAAAARVHVIARERPHRLIELVQESGEFAPSYPQVMCKACGYSASNRLLAPLAPPCDGRPSEHGKRALNQLAQGFMPGSRKLCAVFTWPVRIGLVRSVLLAFQEGLAL